VKKFYCFYCQKDVQPFKFFKWRFCPTCKRYMSDDGEGFYKICDRCEANMPTDAAHCLKCGYAFEGDNARKEYGNLPVNLPLGKGWSEAFVSTVIVILSILAGLAVLYLSFYAVLFIIVVGFVWFLLNMLRIKMRL